MQVSNALAPGRERQSFPYGHFSYVEIMLTDIGCCSLWYKLIHLMTIVSHTTRKLHERIQLFKLNRKLKPNPHGLYKFTRIYRNLQSRIEFSSQCQQQCGLPRTWRTQKQSQSITCTSITQELRIGY